MEVFRPTIPLHGAEGNISTDSILFSIVRVTPLLVVHSPRNGGAHGIYPSHFLHVLRHTSLIEIFGLCKLTRLVFLTQYKLHPSVNYRLTTQGGIEEFIWNADIGKYLMVGFPTNDGTRFLFIFWLNGTDAELTCRFTTHEVDFRNFLLSPRERTYCHIFRAVLCRTCAQTV